MIITLFKDAFSTPNRATTIQVRGAEFLDMLADEENSPSLECRNEDEKKGGAGFVLAQYKQYAMSKKLSDLDPGSETEIFCFDVDSMSEDEIEEAFPLWSAHSAVLYSTFKHNDDNPRLRLLVELSEPVPNFKKEPFHGLYLAAAEKLKVKVDPKTLDRARLYFGPQHRPEYAEDRQRVRFRGDVLEIKKLAPVKGGDRREQVSESFDVTGDRPTRQEIRKLATNLRKSGNERKSKVGSALDAIARGEAYAPAGSVHTTTLHLAFELTFYMPRLDYFWFADKFLKKSWTAMAYEGATLEKRLENWEKAVVSAIAKHDEHRESAAKAKAEVTNGEAPELTSRQLAAVKRLAGRLVMSFRGVYYVYSARCEAYKGPFKSSEVAVAVRDCLSGVEGVEVSEWTRTGEVLRTAIKLNYEYGTTVDNVTYFDRKPPTPWDEKNESICIQAYKWIRWEPIYHQIADDLLRAISGPHYELLEAYLTKFRDLSQPLPALSFVGPKGTWKSRICSILSRFWTTSHAESAGRAKKVMTRFNGHLLKNPVVWSDEELAVTSHGKPQPEAYREAITARSHMVELKGVNDMVLLNCAARHVISVNDDSKIFSSEVDSDSIHATMERFLLLYTSGAEVEAVEDKWRATPEMARLRTGESLLEHIRWIEKNKRYEGRGRLFVHPHTDAQILLRARFADDTLFYIWEVAFDALEREAKMSVSGQLRRMPLLCDESGQLRVSPGRIHGLWGVSKVTQGASVRKPSTQRIGQILSKAGFKLIKEERASKHKTGGWAVNHDVLKQFIDISDTRSWSDVAYWCDQIGLGKLK